MVNSIFDINESSVSDPDEGLFGLLMNWSSIVPNDPKLGCISGRIRTFLRKYPDHYEKLGRRYRYNMTSTCCLGILAGSDLSNVCIICSVRGIDTLYYNTTSKKSDENICLIKYEYYQPTEMIFRRVRMKKEDCLGWEGYKGISEQIERALPWRCLVWTIPELLFNTIMDTCEEVFVENKKK